MYQMLRAEQVFAQFRFAFDFASLSPLQCICFIELRTYQSMNLLKLSNKQSHAETPMLKFCALML